MQISSVNNNVNFNGITPIRVYQNGTEVLDERIIRNTCSKIIKAFSGPYEAKYKPAAAQLEVCDRDYSYIQGMRGYADKFEKADSVPSDYIKVIYDRSNRGYLVTGQFSDDLSSLGKKIGIAIKDAKSKGLRFSQAVENAKEEYWAYVRKIGNDLNNRTTEAYNRTTGTRIGNPMQIIATITTKEAKSHGKPTSTVKLENLVLTNWK